MLVKINYTKQIASSPPTTSGLEPMQAAVLYDYGYMCSETSLVFLKE